MLAQDFSASFCEALTQKFSISHSRYFSLACMQTWQLFCTFCYKPSSRSHWSETWLCFHCSRMLLLAPVHTVHYCTFSAGSWLHGWGPRRSGSSCSKCCKLFGTLNRSLWWFSKVLALGRQCMLGTSCHPACSRICRTAESTLGFGTPWVCWLSYGTPRRGSLRSSGRWEAGPDARRQNLADGAGRDLTQEKSHPWINARYQAGSLACWHVQWNLGQCTLV